MKNIFRGTAIIFLSIALLFDAAPRAHAQFGGTFVDPVNLVQNTLSAANSIITSTNSTAMYLKEFALDPLAWMVAKMAVQSMTRSLVNWINSGFNGSPAFVTDLEGHLLAVGDAVAQPFLRDLSTNASLRSPFQSIIALAIGNQYYLNTSRNGYFTQAAYTLNQFSPNDQAFLNGDFSQGGWGAWYAAVSNPQNNPYGAQLLAEQELASRVSNARGTSLTQLAWGQGFLSWCSTDADAASAASQAIEAGVPNAAQTCKNKDGTNGVIKTPGTVLQGQINKTLGLSGDQLVTADEFDEIIGALMSQLTSQVIGATGLSGVSSVASGGNGFIDQATNPAQYTATGAAGGVSGGVTQAINSQVQQVQLYQDDWQNIQTQAQAANAAAPNCPAVTSTLTQANTALTKANTALTGLQALQAQASTGTTQATVTSVATAFQTLLSSASMPSASDMAYTASQVQDTSASTNTTPNLFTAMKTIATTGVCQ